MCPSCHHRSHLLRSGNARSSLVAWEIVHDHDVAFAQFGKENLLDVGLEGETVDRAVDHERCDCQAPTWCENMEIIPDQAINSENFAEKYSQY